MEHARRGDGKLVHIEDATRLRRDYTCPLCERPVHARQGQHRAWTFAHNPGEGSRDCEEYHPSDSVAGANLPRSEPHQRVFEELDDDSMGVEIEPDGLDWNVVLAIDDIDAADAPRAPLSLLQHAQLEIVASGSMVASVPGTRVKHGAGTARVRVPPSESRYTARLAGRWPSIAFVNRRLETRGLAAAGTLFRFVGGTWRRLNREALVGWGDYLLLVADKNAAPPAHCVESRCDRYGTGQRTWQLWRLALPPVPAASVEKWIRDLGYRIAPPKSRVALAAVPRSFTDDGLPRFYEGDAVLAAVIPPAGAKHARLALGSGAARETLTLTGEGPLFAAVRPGLGRAVLRVEAEDESKVAFEVVRRPSAAELVGELGRLPTLAITISGQRLISNAEVHVVDDRRAMEIGVDTGVDGARVALTIRRRSGRHFWISITSKEASRLLNETAGRAGLRAFEVDAGALGRCAVRIADATDARTQADPRVSRLAGWLRVTTYASDAANSSPPFVTRAASAVESLRVATAFGAAPLTASQMRAAVRRSRME